MRLVLLGEDALRCEATPGPLTIESPTPDQVYTPFHMLASALAVCTLSVLHAWAANAKLHAHGLAIDVRWRFAEDPHRVGAYDIVVDWPGLEPTRREAAIRVAGMCAVKETLRVPPAINVELKS